MCIKTDNNQTKDDNVVVIKNKNDNDKYNNNNNNNDDNKNMTTNNNDTISWSTKIGNYLLRDDDKTNPIYGNNYFKPELYFLGDILLEVLISTMTIVFLTDEARNLYIFILVIHIFLIMFCDYGMDRISSKEYTLNLNKKYNHPNVVKFFVKYFNPYPILPLSLMHVFDLFAISCDIAGPFLLTGYNGPARILFPAIFGFPQLWLVACYFDPNPTAQKEVKRVQVGNYYCTTCNKNCGVFDVNGRSSVCSNNHSKGTTTKEE